MATLGELFAAHRSMTPEENIDVPPSPFLLSWSGRTKSFRISWVSHNLSFLIPFSFLKQHNYFFQIQPSSYPYGLFIWYYNIDLGWSATEGKFIFDENDLDTHLTSGGGVPLEECLERWQKEVNFNALLTKSVIPISAEECRCEPALPASTDTKAYPYVLFPAVTLSPPNLQPLIDEANKRLIPPSLPSLEDANGCRLLFSFWSTYNDYRVSQISQIRKAINAHYRVRFLEALTVTQQIERKFQSSQWGRSEMMLLDALLRQNASRFNSDFEILKDAEVSIQGTNYFPDFLVRHRDQRVHIVVEIDEPYAASSKQPIHFLGYNEARDSTFQGSGFVTYRIDEMRVLNNADEVAKDVLALANTCLDMQPFKSCLPSTPRWTYEESLIFAFRNTRG